MAAARGVTLARMSLRRKPASGPLEAPAIHVSPAVVVQRVLDGEPSAIWRGLTVESAISAWFEPCRRETDGRYSLQFTGDSGEFYVKYASILDCAHRGDSGEYLFLLHDEGYPDSIVKVRVAALSAGRTAMEVSHFAPPEDLVEGYREGWSDYLDSFARYLSAGLPGDRPEVGPG
jgi:hypothetical protein